jgi:phosphate:Na+ symporter
MIGTLLGGIGAFLLGMTLLTDGLQAVGGSTLRAALDRTTRSTFVAVVVGALATVAIQSSSATTLMVIGFVRAGLLPFEHAIGLIFGANIGTTATGWIVATVGLKVDIGVLALPLVGIGGIGKLAFRGKMGLAAQGLAGFGLLLVGIDLIEAAIAQHGSALIPNAIPGGPLVTRLVFVVVGTVMTIIMQSSSAAMATTLAAVHAGAIGFESAAALVIGQNVGTTVTAILGATGGSIDARRAAGAHVVFNVGTAALALLLLPLFVEVVHDASTSDEPATELALFHTAFNLLGVLIFAPATKPLAAALRRFLPDRESPLTQRLATRGPSQPTIDVVAARRTATDIAGALADVARDRIALQHGRRQAAYSIEEIRDALAKTRVALDASSGTTTDNDTIARRVATIDALDHLGRLADALEDKESLRRLHAIDEFDTLRDAVGVGLEVASEWAASDHSGPPPHLEPLSQRVAAERKRHRAERIADAAHGQITPSHAELELEAMRCLDRVVYHAWRAFHHLVEAREGQQSSADPGIE